jgi:hypothetical protein
MLAIRALVASFLALGLASATVAPPGLASAPVLPADPTSTSGAPTAEASVRPFEPIHHERVDLPDGVMPWAPTWSPDGDHVLLHDYNGGHEWIVDAATGRSRCISCGFADRPSIIGAFSYLFDDGKRMFIANELGDKAAVLECAPSVLDCQQHEYVPLVHGDDDSTSAGKPSFGRRTYHLSPDGEHLGYSIIRLDSLIMLVARMERADDAYRLVDHKVINPTPATSALDTDARRWSHGSQLWEFKSFADGGRSAIIVGEPTSANVDMLKLDLKTGETTRLTAHPDWDEDGAPSPDGEHLLVGSWRGMQRVEALGLFPNEPFLAYPFFAGVAGYYVSSRAGFGCDIQPWLLGSDGDRGGTLIGQPLHPYRGGQEIAGNNLAGYAFWSPDSTRVLLQGRHLGDPSPEANAYVQQKGTAPSQVIIARLDREPTDPMPTVRTVVGSWAPTPQEYTGAFGRPGVTVVDGPAGGTATIVRGGTVAGLVATVVYQQYTADGETFINGTEDVAGSPVRAVLRYTADLTATDAGGEQVGYSDIDLTFQQKTENPQPHEPPSTVSGSADVEYRGRHAIGIPPSAPCPQDMPTPSTLQLSAQQVESKGQPRVEVKVTTTILGDTRAVRRASVQLDGEQAFTDDEGVAVLPVHGRPRTRTITAHAGDTFDPGQIRLHAPSRVTEQGPPSLVDAAGSTAAARALPVTGGAPSAALGGLALLAALVARRWWTRKALP